MMMLDLVHALMYVGMCLLAAPVLLLGVMLYRYMLLRSALSDIPGPTPSFYFGNAKMLLDKNGERIPFLYVQKDLQKQYGDLVKFAIGSIPMVEIYGVARVHALLTDTL